jgi:hypothetical protein
MENVLTTIITSSLVGTVAGAAIHEILEGLKSKRDAKLTALVVAVSLEGYAITCANNIEDHKTARSSDGFAGSLLASVPDLPQLSVVAGFLRRRKVSIANRILVFPQEVRQADQLVAFWLDVVGDEDAMHQEAVNQVAKMGLQSLNLARDIRVEFKLPIRDLPFGKSNVRQIFNNMVDTSISD